ncbi:MAG: cysteine desulfurase [Alphaproteobacteria bacterium]|nr:cysteine desulfurase [Alphaproteobacteria bacterium]
MKKDLKKLFPIFANNPGLVYLDSAATAQKPQSVIDAELNFYARDYSNIHRGLYPLTKRTNLAYQGAREKVAKFIGAQWGEVIFTSGATMGLNLLAHSLDFKKGDEVIISEAEHHANIVPWQQTPATLRIMPVASDGEVDLKWLAKNITKKTRLVSFAAQSNVFGKVVDIAGVVKIAHKAGALVALDATQLVCHTRIDVKKLGVDFIAFSAHKLYGPTGIGALYMPAKLRDKLRPFLTGGDMIRTVSFEKTEFAFGPQRFEAGTPPIAQAIAFGAAVDFASSIDIDKTGLTKYARKKLAAVPGIKFISPETANGLVAFIIDGVSNFDIAVKVGAKGVCMRAGLHCAEPIHAKLGLDKNGGTLRMSFGAYNDKADVDIAVAAIKQALKELR